ncbi:alpha/beta hydrolase fold domain-containing protein [Sarocladium implicatum]|nr:alpha/beta hydrolase fold domain-containing protein [Sarocladium implicatum]
MPSITAHLIHLYVAWILNAKATAASPQKTLQSMHDTYLRPKSHNPPQTLGPDVSVERVDVNDWPLYRVSPTTTTTTKAQGERDAMLYIHGGSFYKEIFSQHWSFVAQVVKDTGLDVLVPIYPLLPRPAATAAQLAQGFMEIIRLSTQRVVCIAGDSAGGMLSLATAQQLPKKYPDLASQLQSLILISPVVDISLSHPEVRKLEAVDPMLAIDGIRELTKYLAGGLPMNDPVTSPLFGEIDRLPPTMLLSGTHDMLCSDARRLSAKVQGKGTENGLPGSFQSDRFTYVEKPDMIHVYPLLPHPEGAEAREMIMHFVKKHMS